MEFLIFLITVILAIATVICIVVSAAFFMDSINGEPVTIWLSICILLFGLTFASTVYNTLAGTWGTAHEKVYPKENYIVNMTDTDIFIYDKVSGSQIFATKEKRHFDMIDHFSGCKFIEYTGWTLDPDKKEILFEIPKEK